MDIEALKQIGILDEQAEQILCMHNLALKSVEEQAEKSRSEFEHNLKFKTALEKQLASSKARNVQLVNSLLDYNALSLGDDGEIVGLAEQLEKIKKEADYMFYEETEKQPYAFTGSVGSFLRKDKDVKNPFAKESFNLTEQSKIFKEDKELAQTMIRQASI